MTKQIMFDTPLAERMRPVSIEEFVGQEHVTAPGKLLHHIISQAEPCSLIFWGPPGTGKTTLAHIIAQASNAEFAALSAVTSGIKDVRQVIAAAIERYEANARRTMLFIDEIHRFNKAQQDAFLPHVENGDIILVGATTENPSFEVVAPLLSRTKVILLQQLNERGFTISRIDLIRDKVSEAFLDEDEKLVRVIYLIPEYEIAED